MGKNDSVTDAYQEYVKMREEGMSHEVALIEFDYMQAVQFARLKKRIAEQYPETKERESA